MRAVGFYLLQYQPEGAIQTDYSQLIEQYCKEESHNLLSVFKGVKENAYYDMEKFFSNPDQYPALILIPDPKHLAGDMQTLVKRLISLYRLGCTVKCISSEFTDPLQSGLYTLPISSKFKTPRLFNNRSVISRAAMGKVLGKTPYGYGVGKNGNMVVIDHEAQLVKDIFQWYTNGKDGQMRMGLRRIANYLNMYGRTTRNGNTWNQVSVQGILNNRAYIGTYNRYGVHIASNHDPIIETSVFNLAQGVMASRSPVRKAREIEPFLLSGLVLCAVCKRQLFGTTQIRKWQHEDGTKREKRYRYYMCQLRSSRDSDKKHVLYRAAELENSVIESICQVYKNLKIDTVTLNDYSREMLNKRLIKSQKQFINNLQDVAQGTYGIQHLIRSLELLEELQAQAQNTQNDNPVFKIHIGDLSYEKLNTDFDHARAIIKSCIQYAIVSTRKVKITVKTISNSIK